MSTVYADQASAVADLDNSRLVGQRQLDQDGSPLYAHEEPRYQRWLRRQHGLVSHTDTYPPQFAGQLRVSYATVFADRQSGFLNDPPTASCCEPADRLIDLMI